MLCVCVCVCVCAQILVRRADDVPEMLLSRRDLRPVLGSPDVSAENLTGDSSANVLEQIGVFQSFSDSALDGRQA